MEDGNRILCLCFSKSSISMKWAAELRRAIFVSNRNSRLQYGLKDCRDLFIYGEQTVQSSGSASPRGVTLQDMKVLQGVKKARKRTYIPPENMVLPSLMVVPLQNPLIPSSDSMVEKASTVLAPWALCDLVFRVSNGCVAYVVMVPATAPLAKFTAVFWLI